MNRFSICAGGSVIRVAREMSRETERWQHVIPTSCFPGSDMRSQELNAESLLGNLQERLLPLVRSSCSGIDVYVHSVQTGGALLVLIQLATQLTLEASIRSRPGAVVVLPEQPGDDDALLLSALSDYTVRGILDWSAAVREDTFPAVPSGRGARMFGSRLYQE